MPVPKLCRPCPGTVKRREPRKKQAWESDSEDEEDEMRQTQTWWEKPSVTYA